MPKTVSGRNVYNLFCVLRIPTAKQNPPLRSETANLLSPSKKMRTKWCPSRTPPFFVCRLHNVDGIPQTSKQVIRFGASLKLQDSGRKRERRLVVAICAPREYSEACGESRLRCSAPKREEEGKYHVYKFPWFFAFTGKVLAQFKAGYAPSVARNNKSFKLSRELRKLGKCISVIARKMVSLDYFGDRPNLSLTCVPDFAEPPKLRKGQIKNAFQNYLNYQNESL